LFAGAGIKVGQTIGATDRDGAYVTNKPFAPADVSYTMLASLGINPRKQLRTPDGRPVEILDTGDFMQELWS
jgi:hypothetical protein